jgi:hypothetical protein
MSCRWRSKGERVLWWAQIGVEIFQAQHVRVFETVSAIPHLFHTACGDCMYLILSPSKVAVNRLLCWSGIHREIGLQGRGNGSMKTLEKTGIILH